MQFPDASGVPVNMMYLRDATFYDRVAQFVDHEPIGSDDPCLRGLMASIGIVEGKPFQPDARQGQILEKAVQVAPKMAGALNAGSDVIKDRRQVPL